MEKLALVFDCGATNVRVVAVNPFGEIKASRSFSNSTTEDPYYTGGRVWDVNEIWEKLCAASKEVISKIDRESIVAVTTTTFGVDGTFLDKEGNLIYPVISWQCERTVPIMQRIDKYIPLEELYQISGVNAYSFNTINKLIWFRENKPEIVSNADCFLFMPALINFLLTGEKCNDITMLGTSMLADMQYRSLSVKILDAIGYDSNLFGKIGRSGDVVGVISHNASEVTGIPEGTKVCLTGHDTQFAIFGSGADTNQVVLSSGTWEILMARCNKFSTSKTQFNNGITTEFDAVEGLYNIGLNWSGSGIVEWVRSKFFAECSPDNCYDIMMSEAGKVLPGSGGVFINPDFNFIKDADIRGVIGGLTLNTSRGEIMRATFESLSFQTRIALEALQQAGKFSAKNIICVGGGSKNTLWNQIRADVLNIPVITIDQKETTVLGASFFAFTAAGVYDSPDEAKTNIKYNPQITNPSGNAETYQNLFQQWRKKINL